MDFYENVVVEYLRADRSIFVNTECCIQLNESDNPDTSGLHWYCDAVAVDLRNSAAFLCEVTFASQLSGLSKRLTGWDANWEGVCKALSRDSNIPSAWPLRPWLFIPENLIPKILAKTDKLEELPSPKITPLEMVQPWKYVSWNRKSEIQKPDSIPKNMQ